MMDGIISALLIVGLIIVLLILIYLVDRVNTIERETRHLKAEQSRPVVVQQGPFAGLSGRRLWDAMSGKAPMGMDEATLYSVRGRFGLLMQLHIESLFEEGQRDAQRGLSGDPKNPRVIATPDGPIESWLPPGQVKILYQCGIDSALGQEDALMGVRASLNEAGKILYNQSGVQPVPVQSDLLLPGPLPPLPDLVGQPAATSSAATPTDPLAVNLPSSSNNPRS